MRALEFLYEGGWASTMTQSSHLTPAIVAAAIQPLNEFAAKLNKFLAAKGMPPIKMGKPCGSATYYQRDLQIDPTREYGDIDVNIYIPRIPNTTNNANADMYKEATLEFCNADNTYITKNGTNVIFKIGNEYVQVDLVPLYYENEQWARALAPEWRVKGVLTASLTSSLAEALNLSFGQFGVQVKTINNEPVLFRLSSGTTLHTITTNPDTWAMDIAKFFGVTTVDPLLKQNPGMKDEVRTQDIINSIRGIARSLEASGILGSKGITDASADALCSRIVDIYLKKINGSINSSKFNKAETPQAIKKAAATKEMLARESHRIVKQFGI